MALHKSFDLPPDQLFDWIEEVPIACGSIGQVHRARLSEKGAALACCDPGEVVAVKVREGCAAQRVWGVAWLLEPNQPNPHNMSTGAGTARTPRMRLSQHLPAHCTVSI